MHSLILDLGVVILASIILICTWRKWCIGLEYRMKVQCPLKWRKAQTRREYGNAYMVKKDYVGAVNEYSRGLRLCPTDIDLLNARAFIYFKVGCFHSALNDINMALTLNEDPEHKRSRYLKVNILWGLQMYEEALDFANHWLRKSTLTTQNSLSLESRCRDMIEQSKGKFDFDVMMNLSQSRQVVAEYTGSLKIVKIPGKGRGAIASSDLQPGELLMVARAFAYASDEDVGMLFGTTFRYNAVSVPIGDINDYLVAFIFTKLSLEPSLRARFFELYAGPSFVSSSVKPTTAEMDQEDVNWIRAIVGFNGFKSCENNCNIGLWLLPSYLNHSCVDTTANFQINSEFMFIRAAKAIPIGTELTISYVPPEDLRRRIIIEHWQFQCRCNLCSFEDSEASEVRKEMEDTLQQIQMQMDSADLKLQTSRIFNLIRLRKSFPRGNVYLLDPCIFELFHRMAYRPQDVPTARIIRIYKKIYESAEGCLHDGRASEVAIMLIKLFGGLGDKINGGKWIEKLKLNLIATYGSIEAVKLFEHDFVEELKSALGIDFFAEMV